MSYCLWNERSVLAVGVLQENLSVAKREQITAMHFDPRSVRPRSGEGPLGYAPIAVDKVARTTPVGIGKDLPDLCEAGDRGFAASKSATAYVGAGRGLANAVAGHERHARLKVVPVPRICEGLQYFRGHFMNCCLHDRAPPYGL